MIIVETEFYTKEIRLTGKALAFLLALFLFYGLVLVAYAYFMHTYYTVTVTNIVEKQSVALSELDAKQLEIHESVKEMLDEIMDN